MRKVTDESRFRRPGSDMHARLHHLARTERLLSAHIPYAAQLTDTVVRTCEGDYVQSFRLGGVSFESTDDRELNDWHERLNVLWRNIASPQVALWTHLVRRRESVYPEGEFAPGFARQLNQKYRQRIQHETLMVNDLYLTVVFRPLRNAARALTFRALRHADHTMEGAARTAALESIAKLASLLSAALARYEPVPLVIRPAGSHALCSESLEFFSFLINGERFAVPLPRGPLNESLGLRGCFSAGNSSSTAVPSEHVSGPCWASRNTRLSPRLVCSMRCWRPRFR
jgi:type IV secretion system protein VirB4